MPPKQPWTLAEAPEPERRWWRPGEPVHQRSSCDMCPLGASRPDAGVIGCGVDGSPGASVYVLGGPVGVTGRPVEGMVGRVMRSELGERAAYDATVRCRPLGVVTDDEMDAAEKTCLTHTRQAIERLKPREIVALGPDAARQLLGDDPGPRPLFGSHGWYRAGGASIPVRILPQVAGGRDVIQHVTSDLGRRRFLERLHADIPGEPTPHGDVIEICFEDDIVGMVDELSGEAAVFFDTETFGRAWTDDRRIFLISFASIDVLNIRANRTWWWDLDKAKREWSPDDLQRAWNAIAGLMLDTRVEKVAWNAKFDAHVVAVEFGVVPNPLVDAMSLWKLHDVSEGASLEASGWRAGVGGHKAEAQEAVTAAVIAVRRLRAKRGRVQAKDPSADLPDQAYEEVAEAFRCDVDDLRIAVRNTARDDRAHAYALADRPVLSEYNALDSANGARVYALDRHRLAVAGKGVRGLWDHVTRPLPRAMTMVERWGIPVDQGALDLFERFLDGRLAEVSDRIQTTASRYFPAGFNPASTPQVAELLYARLKIRPPKIKGKDKKTDAPTVAVTALNMIKDRHPVIADLLEFRTIAKMQSNYGRGMRRWIAQDGRVHPDFRVAHVKSGRLSCSSPNVQTIPTKGEFAKMAKSVFAAIPGWTLVSIDLSQIEVRVAAALSGDPVMCNLYAQGYDFHDNTSRLIAGPVFDCHDWEKASDAVKEADPKRYQLLVDIRRMAKVVIFLLLYGGSDYALAMQLGVLPEQAEAMRRAVLSGYAKLADDIRETVNAARQTGWTWTYWAGEPARGLWLPDLTTPGFDELAKKSRRHAENVAYNHKIQGSSSDLCLSALCRVVDMIEGENLPAEVVTTTHDQILIHVREDMAEEVGVRSQEMMNTGYYGDGYLENDVPIESDRKHGKSWGALA